MGNQGSKRKSGAVKWRHKHDMENTDNTMDGLEELENITPESYNKFLAWMVEMAENEDADLGSPEFIEHITSCAAKQRTSICESSTGARSRQQSLDTHLTVPRQHSLDSSGGSRYSRQSSRSPEGLLNPKARFRRSKLSRQETVDYSDDGDVPVAMSIGGSFEHDSDCDIVSPETVLINNFSETSFTRPQFRPPLRKNQSCTTYGNIGSSLADLLNVQSRKKSKSLLTMRKMLSENYNDDDVDPEIAGNTAMKLLDDNLLDSNMADILYSVEALWPKVPKQTANN